VANQKLCPGLVSPAGDDGEVLQHLKAGREIGFFVEKHTLDVYQVFRMNPVENKK
jgi:hypothetical protein